MTNERFDPAAGPVPRLSDSALAEIEALRGSDRLQRIFDSRLAQRRTERAGHVVTAARRPSGAAGTPDRTVPDGAAQGGRGRAFSRRARVLVGLFPLYLATAVLAVEGIRALRAEPDRVAFVSAGSAPASADIEASEPRGADGGPERPDERRAGPGSSRPEIGAPPEPRSGVRPGAEAGGAEPRGASLANSPAAPERSSAPKARPAALAAAPVRAGSAAKASDDLAKAAEAGKSERQEGGQQAGRTVGHSEGQHGELGTTAREIRRMVPRAASDQARPTEPEEATGAGGRPLAAQGTTGFGTTGPGRSELGAADLGRADLEATGADARPAAEPAERAAGAAGPASSGVAAARPTARDPLGVDAAADEDETIPQATWGAREAPQRSALRSEVLGQAVGQVGPGRADAETEPQPGSSAMQGPADTAPRRAQSQATPAGRPVSAPPRIVVHYRRDAGPDAARRLAAELLERGYARTELRPVSFDITRPNVRFFHDQNRPVARKIHELVRATGRGSELRDFTHYSPRPSVGTVEVWLPG